MTSIMLLSLEGLRLEYDTSMWSDSVWKEFRDRIIGFTRVAEFLERTDMSGDWKPGSKTTRDPAMDYSPTTGNEAAAARAKVGEIKDREPDCLAKAKERGQLTFTLVEQDYSSPTVICEWIKVNTETCPKEKLFEALDKAISIRDTKVTRKDPD